MLILRSATPILAPTSLLILTRSYSSSNPLRCKQEDDLKSVPRLLIIHSDLLRRVHDDLALRIDSVHEDLRGLIAKIDPEYQQAPNIQAHPEISSVEIPEHVEAKFELASTIGRPELVANAWPLDEAADALIVHFHQSTAKFREGTLLTERTPNAEQFLSLLKCAWIMRRVKASTHLQQIGPHSHWPSYIKQLDQVALVQLSCFIHPSNTFTNSHCLKNAGVLLQALHGSWWHPTFPICQIRLLTSGLRYRRMKATNSAHSERRNLSWMNCWTCECCLGGHKSTVSTYKTCASSPLAGGQGQRLKLLFNQIDSRFRVALQRPRSPSSPTGYSSITNVGPSKYLLVGSRNKIRLCSPQHLRYSSIRQSRFSLKLADHVAP